MKRNYPGHRFLISLAIFLIITNPSLWFNARESQMSSSYSLRFYGHGEDDIDRVKIKIDSPEVPADLGATDFTIEFWMKANPNENTGSAACNTNDGWVTANTLLDRDIWGAGDYGDYGIAISNGSIAFGVNNQSNEGNTICGRTNVADGNWHHVAVMRNQSSGSLRIYVDGILDGQGNGPTGDLSYRNDRTTSYPNDVYLVIGAEKHDAGNSYPSFSGWVDELRLSNVIRYTADFTPPSAPFLSDTNTLALYHFEEGPAGACTGDILDSSGANGGPSNGICRYGGTTPAGPVYSIDSPFLSATETPTATATIEATSSPTNTPTSTATPNSDPVPTTTIYLPIVVQSSPESNSTNSTSLPTCRSLTMNLMVLSLIIYTKWQRHKSLI